MLAVDTAFKGTLLPKFLLHVCRKKLTSKDLQRIRANMTAETCTLTTMCSGSGMAELAHVALTSTFGRSTQLLHSCEMVPFKQGHLRRIVHDAIEAQDACLFKEFGDLPSGSGRCVVHNADCLVQTRPFMTIVGYSCKNMSTLNSQRHDRILEDKIGSSGSTCEHLVNYLSSSAPKTAILENVSEMAKTEEQSCNVRYLNQAVRDRGYGTGTRELTSDQYMLPQARRRAYSVLLRAEDFGLTIEQCEQIIDDIFNFVQSTCSVAPVDLEKILLPNSSPRVLAELDRTQKCTRKSNQDSSSYLHFHQEFLASKGISWRQLQPLDTVAASPWYDCLPPREKEVLNYATTMFKPLLSVDCGQRIDRAGIRQKQPLATVTLGGKTFLFHPMAEGSSKVPLNRLMLGFESMRLQGFPTEVMDKFPMEEQCTDPQLQDMAGNAFPGTVVLAILLGVYKNLPPRVSCVEPQQGSNDMGDVMSLFSD